MRVFQRRRVGGKAWAAGREWGSEGPVFLLHVAAGVLDQPLLLYAGLPPRIRASASPSACRTHGKRPPNHTSLPTSQGLFWQHVSDTHTLRLSSWRPASPPMCTLGTADHSVFPLDRGLVTGIGGLVLWKLQRIRT